MATLVALLLMALFLTAGCGSAGGGGGGSDGSGSGASTSGGTGDDGVDGGDADTPDLNLSEDTLALREGSESTLTLTLTTEPGADVTVTVTLASSDAVGVTTSSCASAGSTATRELTADNWEDGLSVTFCPVDNEEQDGGSRTTLSVEVESADGDYDGLEVPDLDVAVQDDELVYVTEGGAGDEDGSSWANAFASVQDAMDTAAAASPQKAVWVAQGVYRPSAVTEPVLDMAEGVQVWGSFEGDEFTLDDREDPMPEPSSILDGDVNDNDSGEAPDSTYEDNSYHVVNYDAGSYEELNGFTIRNGYAYGSLKDAQGGGIFADDASLTVGQVLLTGNEADDHGGGMALEWTSAGGAVTVYRSLFVDNRTDDDDGGGFYVGDDDYDVTIEDSVFIGNEAGNDAGGAYLEGDGSFTVTNTAFIRNLGTSGGLDLRGDGSLAQLTFHSNRGSYQSGGLHLQDNIDVTARDLHFERNLANSCGTCGQTITVNSATVSFTNISVVDSGGNSDGGALHANHANADVTLTNATFVNNDNAALVTENASAALVGTNIVFFDNEAQTSQVSGSLSVTSTCQEATESSGDTPFDTIPASGERFLLQSSNLCLDSGDDTAADAAFGEDAWMSLTTAADFSVDTGTVDIGRHYDPARPVISTFDTSGSNLVWTTQQATSCLLTGESGSNSFSLPKAVPTSHSGTDYPLDGSGTYYLICQGEETLDETGQHTVARLSVD